MVLPENAEAVRSGSSDKLKFIFHYEPRPLQDGFFYEGPVARPLQVARRLFLTPPLQDGVLFCYKELKNLIAS